MPGITFVQANVAYYGVAGSGGALPCAYGSPNVAGNIGIAWVTADAGAGPASCTDTKGNTWYGLRGYFTNSGFSTGFVCPNLKAGANTVTVGGLVAGTGGSQAPVLTVLEYAPPGSGQVGIQALQGGLGVNGVQGWIYGPVLTFETLFAASSGPYYSTLIVFLSTTEADVSATARTWSIGSVPAGAGVSAVRIQYEDSGTLETGAVADCTVENLPENFITFAFTPTTPALNGESVALIGLLFNTTA